MGHIIHLNKIPPKNMDHEDNLRINGNTVKCHQTLVSAFLCCLQNKNCMILSNGLQRKNLSLGYNNQVLEQHRNLHPQYAKMAMS